MGSTPRTMLGGFGLALLVVALAGVAAHRTLDTLGGSTQWVRHVYEVIDGVDDVEHAIVDAEAAQRSYLLTGRSEFLEHFQDTVQNLGRRLEQVSALMADTPQQQARLAALRPQIEQRIEALAAGIRRMQTGDAAGAAELVADPAGLELTAQVREAIATIQRSQSQLLEARTAGAIDRRHRAGWMIAAGATLAGLVVAGAAWLAFGSLQRQRRIEREAARQAAADSQKLARIVESISDAFMSLDRRWHIRHVNARAVETLQRPREALTGKVFWDLFPETVGSMFDTECRRALATGQAASFEIYAPALKGWLAVQAYPAEEGLAIYFRDISAQRQATAALEHSENVLRLAVAAGDLGTWCYYPQAGEVSWSARCKAMFGLPNDTQLDYATFLARIDPEDRPGVEAAVRRALDPAGDGSLDAEYKVIWPDGTQRWIRAQGKTFFQPNDPSHRAERMVGTTQDITERKAAEAQLRQSRDRLALALEAGEAGMARFDLQTGAVEANARYLEILGYGPGSAAPGYQAWRERVHPEDVPRVEVAFDQARRDHTTAHVEYRALWPDGQVRWVRASGRFEYGPDGQAAGAIRVAFDITALRLARDEAEAASQAKDRFLAALSHELRTPLTPVMMMVTALQADAQVPAELREDLALIRRNIELEVRLIDDLLDVTRVIHGKLQLKTGPARVHGLLRHAVEICRGDIESKNLTINWDLGASEDQVTADAARLEQVFWNLIKNAVKFTPVGGTITVRSRNAGNPLPRIPASTPEEAPAPSGASLAGERIAIEVTDTGIGIDPEVMPRLFAAFQQGGAGVTRRFGGLGLGLAISKEIVALHGGRIEARSPGRHRGATFLVELATAPRGEPIVAHLTDAPARDGRVRILLVEDHADTARMLKRLLEGSGYAVTTAQSVAEALALTSSECFDVMISDIGLPDGTGLELMAQVKARTPLPAIAMSGYGMDSDIQCSRDAGFAAHLTKPVDLDKLEETIRRVAGMPVDASAG